MSAPDADPGRLAEVRVADPADPADRTVEAVLLPGVGARLHRVRAFGHDVIAGPADSSAHLASPFFGGGYVMAPWCNRMPVGPIAVGGRTVDLRPNFRDGTAIHGQVYDAPWDRRPDGTFAIRGGEDGSGWPWAYEVRLAASVSGPALRLDLALENRSSEPMPAGLGLHPWFVRPVEVAVDAAAAYPTNLRTQPIPDPVTGPFDLHRLAPMAMGLDATWTSLRHPEVELRWPVLGIAATMRLRAPTLCIVAANPTDVDATAVEPETHAPDGLRRLLAGEPDAMTLLAPGDVLPLRIELAFRRA